MVTCVVEITWRAVIICGVPALMAATAVSTSGKSTCVDARNVIRIKTLNSPAVDCSCLLMVGIAQSSVTDSASTSAVTFAGVLAVVMADTVLTIASTISSFLSQSPVTVVSDLRVLTNVSPTDGFEEG